MKLIIIRLSHILAWIAFAYISCVILFMIMMAGAGEFSGNNGGFYMALLLGVLPWLACLIINWIAVGSARILPWKSISDESDPKA
jgi:hypothetical protein